MKKLMKKLLKEAKKIRRMLEEEQRKCMEEGIIGKDCIISSTGEIIPFPKNTAEKDL